jgi:hypothetical protein
MGLYFVTNFGEYIVSKWKIAKVDSVRIIEESDSEYESQIEQQSPEIKILEVRKDKDEEINIQEKRETIKKFTELLEKDTPINRIKEIINFESIKEEAKWKIYSRALDLKKQNKPRKALDLMKSIDQYIKMIIRWFFLVTKCLMLTNQWKEIEAWEYRYMYLSERQLQTNKFIMGEISKIFSYHSEMVQKERGILMRDIANKADW